MQQTVESLSQAVSVALNSFLDKGVMNNYKYLYKNLLDNLLELYQEGILIVPFTEIFQQILHKLPSWMFDKQTFLESLILV